jgi:hypothetical protein
MRFQLMRLLTLVVAVSLALVGGAIGTATIASAQPQQATGGNTVPVTGKDKQGRTLFTGTFTATGPVKPNSGNSERPLLVTGQLKGELDPSKGQAQGQGQGPVKPVNQQVEMPAAASSSQKTNPIAGGGGESLQGQTAVCNVLDLTLGPLDLNLLGLEVHLDVVHLVIDANPAGGILGQLLCALAGGVPQPPTGLDAIISLLNQILAALGG